MLQPLPNIFLAYFHFQQNNQKLEQAGVSHIIKLSYNKPAVSASDDFNKIYLEKHNLHGQTLDVLVVKLENEIMKNKVFTIFSWYELEYFILKAGKSQLKYLEVFNDLYCKPSREHISTVNSFILEALKNDCSSILLIDRFPEITCQVLHALILETPTFTPVWLWSPRSWCQWGGWPAARLCALWWVETWRMLLTSVTEWRLTWRPGRLMSMVWSLSDSSWGASPASLLINTWKLISIQRGDWRIIIQYSDISSPQTMFIYYFRLSMVSWIWSPVTLKM